MDKQWSSMTDRERDAALAEAMGWKEVRHYPSRNSPLRWVGRSPQTHRSNTPIPPFTTSLDAMRLVEDFLSGWPGLLRAYIEALISVVSPAHWSVRSEQWELHSITLVALVRATPAQRAEAAYRVLTERQL